MKNYVLLVISLLLITNLSAQESDYNPYRSNRYLGIEGIYNCTLLDLDANNYRDGGGFSFSGFKDLTSSRNPLVLQWGGEGLFAVSGKDREYYVDDAFGTSRISSPTNLTFGLNGLLRLEYRKYAVHPYIDGFVGGRLFSSGYTNDNGFDNEDDYQAMTTTGRLAYGVGAGVFVPVSNRLDINFRAAYTHTPEMYYINMNDFIDNTRNTLAPLAESEYDMLSFHVGVRYRFEQQSREERRREKRERRDRDCYSDYNDCCDSPCDSRRRQRRQRAGNILQGISIGLDIYNSSRSNGDDCPADSYPDRDYEDDNNEPYTPPRDSDEPYRPTNTGNNGTNTNTNTCPPTYDNNTSSNPQPSYSPRPNKGTRNSSSGGSTRSGSNPNSTPSVRSGKGSRGG